MIIIADGYIRIYNRQVSKTYKAFWLVNGEARASLRAFKTAEAAVMYGQRAVGRYKRLAAHGKPQEEREA